MTREEWAERLPVIQAWCEGKVVQCGPATGDRVWLDYTGREPLFGHHDLIWRIKPEPRKLWLNEYRGNVFGNTHHSKEGSSQEAAARTSELVACHEIPLPPLP